MDKKKIELYKQHYKKDKKFTAHLNNKEFYIDKEEVIDYLKKGAKIKL